VLAASIVAAVTDVRKFKVHNLLTLPLLLSGLIYHGSIGGLSGVGTSLLGALFGFGILFLFYLMGGVGGGDVKLLAAIGAWLGMPLVFYVFLASACAAGVYALGQMLLYGMSRETWVNLQILWLRMKIFGRHLAAEDRVEAELQRPGHRRRVIPFAAMVALGFITLLIVSCLCRNP
jgi:Flp pilus assembly protein protease CpaA